MIGSFIGTFAIGLLSAHIYCCGRQVAGKMYDSFLDIFRATEEDEERMRLDPEEEAEILEWERNHPLKKKDDARHRTKATTKPRPPSKPSGRRKKRKPASRG